MPNQREPPESALPMLLNYTIGYRGGYRFEAEDCSFSTAQISLLAAHVRYNTVMSQTASAIVRSPAEIVQNSPVSQAPNGICYARSGEITIADNDLERMVAAVPAPVAAALSRKAYYFVPLTVSQGDETVIADRYDVALSDNAVCHRNLNLGDAQCVFISTRLMEDKFSVAFEFYINVGHALVERAGVSQNFADLAWQQVESGVRGETSLDAWEARKFATAHGPDAEKFKNRISRRQLRRCDFDLPALALSRCRLLRSARARLSAAGAGSDGRTPAQDRGDFPAESRIRIQHLLSTAGVGLIFFGFRV